MVITEELSMIFHCFYLCRSYKGPRPAFQVVSDNVSSLILGIQGSLRRGTNLNCKFNVEFRIDVFSYLFSGRGSLPPSGQRKLYNLDDFNPMFFPSNWFIVYDKLRNGCTVNFPVCIESKLKWSPVDFLLHLLNLQSLMVKSPVNFCGLVTFLYLTAVSRPVKSFVDVVGF